MEWISVTDRFPLLYDFVLVFANNRGSSEPKPISIARIISEMPIKWDFLGMLEVGAYMDIEYGIDSDNITHWMPLPEEPALEGYCDECKNEMVACVCMN